MLKYSLMAGAAALCLSAASPDAADVRAFPTAKGYGALAKGGRGGVVRFVTNLEDDGPGSLREALKGSGPRTVVFRVGGMIELTHNLVVRNPYITIAGQTAPGDGICIRNASLRIKTHDVVVRHFCSRPGNEKVLPGTGLDNRDAIQIEHAQNVILDHVSTSWSTDELVTGWFDDTDNVTVQNSILAEPLWKAGHSKGNHSMGLLFGRGTGSVSIVDNLFAHIGFRTPEISSGVRADVVNNIVYNWGKRGTTISIGSKKYLGPSCVNVMNNVYKPGANSVVDGRIVVGLGSVEPKGYQVYVGGNVNHQGAPANSVSGSTLQALVSSPVDGGPHDIMPAGTAGLLDRVLAEAGRTVPRRDVVDMRVVADVSQGVSRRPNSPADVGGWPQLRSGTPYPDADQDGIDDTWERAEGLDPADPADQNLDRDGNGYTNLEEFLNTLAGDPSGPVEPPPPGDDAIRVAVEAAGEMSARCWPSG
jgi:pectate lyase